MNEMNGKVALITGAATGIGRAAAELFAREGASLILADLNEEQGEGLAAQLRAGGSKALFVKTDVSKAEDCERMVNAAVEHFGRLDAAFNNAGISDGPLPPGTIDYPLELWDRIIAVNLSGVFYCMRYEIRAMLATGGWQHRQHLVAGRTGRVCGYSGLRGGQARGRWPHHDGRARVRRQGHPL